MGLIEGNNRSVEIYQNNVRGTPSEHEMMVYQTMAKSAVESKMYRGIGEQAGVMMIMLAAREMGIAPMMALNGGLNIINGKVEISARMMSALIRKAGHRISIKQNDENICVLEGVRNDTQERLSVSFSLAEAQKAGLVKAGGGWTKWPKDMCFARALSRLSRQLFSDVIGIGYVEGEIRPTENDIIKLENIEMEIESDPQKDKEDENSMFKWIDPLEHHFFEEYIQVVMKHFGWSRRETIKKFLDDKDIISKFKTWKVKRNNL